MSLDLIDDQSTLVQVMAWCRQATSHYLSQCWSRSLSPYGVTRPEWVNSLRPSDALWHHRSESTFPQYDEISFSIVMIHRVHAMKYTHGFYFVLFCTTPKQSARHLHAYSIWRRRIINTGYFQNHNMINTSIQNKTDWPTVDGPFSAVFALKEMLIMRLTYFSS